MQTVCSEFCCRLSVTQGSKGDMLCGYQIAAVAVLLLLPGTAYLSGLNRAGH